MSDTTLPIGPRCQQCLAPVSSFAGYCSRCGAAASEPNDADDSLLTRVRVLVGRELEVEREIGRGGMAAVFVANDAALQRRVAIKVLLPELAEDPAMTARFLREARTVAALRHPHVVSVYGVRGDGNTSAIVMEFVEGRGLDAMLSEHKALDLGVAGLLLAQAASGLQHAHERGTIHRDVKPANVLIDREGRAVVSDFGIALTEGTKRITGTGMVVGSMAYMSPEQRTGGTVGPAADQYALGIMAFELFAGRLPFVGTFPEMLAAHLHDPPPPLATLCPALSAKAVATVSRMLAKEPAARFKDLREPERVFRSLVRDTQATTMTLASMSGVVRSGRIPLRAAVPALADPLATADELTPVLENSRSRRAALPTGVVLTVLLCSGATWLWRANRRSPAVNFPVSTIGVASSPPNDSSRPLPSGSSSSGSNARTPARPKASASSLSARATEPNATSAPASMPAPDASPPVTPPGTRDSVIAAPSPVSAEAGRGSTNSPSGGTERPASATLSDARTVARQFVTMLNQHRWSELDRLGTLGGDAGLRAELVRLVRSAASFAAGFESVASVPSSAADGFVTEFVLDLEWRGGKKLVTVQLRAVAQFGTWQLAAFGVAPAD